MHELAEKRSNIYGLLSLIYRQEPTVEIVRELRKPEFIQTLVELGVSVDKEFITQSDEQTVQDLSLEYTRLFIGPGRHIPPYESVHREGEGLLWGESTATVKKLIEFLGLRYRDDFSDMPDHISVEFELMQKLADRENEAREQNDEQAILRCLEFQKKFIDDHLSQWIPTFCVKVAKTSDSSFYGQMAKLTREFIEFDKKQVNDILSRTTDY